MDNGRLEVFLCHASEDKPVVRDLHQRLTRDGYKPWLDEVDLLGGQEWQPAIVRAVRQSDVVLVCLSQHSINKRGFVQKEIRLAIDTADEFPEDRVFIIPYRLEECDLPDRLSKWQAVDHFHPDGYTKLQRSLKACVIKHEQLNPTTTTTAPPWEKPDPEDLRKWVADIVQLTSPSLDELIDDLQVTTQQLTANPSENILMQACMASRAAFAHYYDLYSSAPAQALDAGHRLLSQLQACSRVATWGDDESPAKFYAASIQKRTEVLHQLLHG